MAKKIELMLNELGNQLIEPETVYRDNFLKRNVHWKIGDKRLDLFRIVAKDKTRCYPFSKQPNTDYTTKEKLHVGNDAKDCIWDYKIDWKAKNGNGGTLDPKIAVNTFKLTQFLIPLFAITGLLGMLFYRIKKNKYCK